MNILFALTTIITLLLCPFMHLPYGYYTFLRILACGYFVYISYLFYPQKRTFSFFVSVCFSILFNPFIKIYLSKDIWMICDVMAAITICCLNINDFKKLIKTNSPKKGE